MDKFLNEVKTNFLADYEGYIESVNQFKSDVNNITFEKCQRGECIWGTDAQIKSVNYIITELLKSRCSKELKRNIIVLLDEIMTNVHNGLYYNILRKNGGYEDCVNNTAQDKISEYDKGDSNRNS